MSKRKQESLFWGIVLLLIGAVFLISNLGVDIDVWEVLGDYWPVILNCNRRKKYLATL